MIDERDTIPWSIDIPEKPGLYWWREWGHYTYSMRRLEPRDIEELTERSLNDDWYRRHRDSFAGPIPEPIDVK